MSRNRVSVGRLMALVVGYAVIGLFGFWLAPARADVAAGEPTAAAAPEQDAPPRPAEPLRPFQKGATDVGSIPYSELRDSPGRPLTKSELEAGHWSAARHREALTDTKESVDKAGAWANQAHGAATTSAWSKVTDQGVARAREHNARYESGLSGTDNVGVR